MLDNHVVVDDVLTRAGIPKMERERICGDIDDGLAETIIGSQSVNEIKRLLGEFYAARKASVEPEDK